jgi:hypothetical protein
MAAVVHGLNPGQPIPLEKGAHVASRGGTFLPAADDTGGAEVAFGEDPAEGARERAPLDQCLPVPLVDGKFHLEGDVDLLIPHADISGDPAGAAVGADDCLGPDSLAAIESKRYRVAIGFDAGDETPIPDSGA